MNIQTEPLENRLARVTVEVDMDRLEKARRIAAKRLAKRVNIPGFRKGKAPYKILIQNGLAPQIEMDAIEDLSQEIYRETLEQSDLEPYGPGAFEDYQDDPLPTFIYTVPLQPVVKLNDYKAIRMDYEKPEVTDEQVNLTLRQLQEQHALIEESSSAVVVGNRVMMDIHSQFIDDALEEGDDIPEKGDVFIHQHDTQLLLDSEDEPILPGFIDALVGANQGDTVEFELTIPADNDWDENLHGRKVSFQVEIKNIEIIILPGLNDDFAARVTEEDDEPLTLLQLRMQLREDIQKELDIRARDGYVERVIGEIVAQADIDYPEAMLEDQVEDMLKELDGRLQEQGMNLETYYKVSGVSKDDLIEQYREPAEEVLNRSLILREIVQTENLEINEEEIQHRIEQRLENLGEGSEAVRALFESPQMQSALINEMLQDRVTRYISAMAQGEDPLAAIQLEIEDTDVDSDDVDHPEEDKNKEIALESSPDSDSSDEEDTG